MFAKPFPPEKLGRVGADGHVSAEDVLFLRRQVFKDGIVSPEELDALFTLGEKAPEGVPEWGAFFEESACDFYLREEEPQGYFTQAEFDTLKARVTKDGATASAIELRLMVKLLETAIETPPAMRGFVAEQLRAAFAAKKGAPTPDETNLARRFVFAAGGDGNVAVTRAEAELLFDVNDAAGGAADPAWTDFFVKAVAGHLMAHSGYVAPSREEAQRMHAFVSDHSVNVGGFFRRMIAGGLSALDGGDRRTEQQKRNDARAEDAALAEQVTGGEADWLAERIGRDGAKSATERALIAHLKTLGADLPPTLKAIVDQAA